MFEFNKTETKDHQIKVYLLRVPYHYTAKQISLILGCHQTMVTNSIAGLKDFGLVKFVGTAERSSKGGKAASIYRTVNPGAELADFTKLEPEESDLMINKFIYANPIHNRLVDRYERSSAAME